MTQHELDNAVARATGEPISEISRLGFQAGMLELEDVELEESGISEFNIIGWDELDPHRNVAFRDQRPRLVVA